MEILMASVNINGKMEILIQGHFKMGKSMAKVNGRRFNNKTKKGFNRHLINMRDSMKRI